MIWRLSGWSSTTKMRLLMPFPSVARLRLTHPNVQMKTRLKGLGSDISNATMHTLRLRRGVAQELLSTCRLHLPLDNDGEPEGKCRALARLRLDPNPPAMHLNDPLGDGQSQAGATLLASDGIVGLLELLE